MMEEIIILLKILNLIIMQQYKIDVFKIGSFKFYMYLDKDGWSNYQYLNKLIFFNNFLIWLLLKYLL